MHYTHCIVSDTTMCTIVYTKKLIPWFGAFIMATPTNQAMVVTAFLVQPNIWSMQDKIK